MGITNEILKEHLQGLSMDKKLVAEFDQLPTQTKANFTRQYNKLHSDPMKKIVTKGGKKGSSSKATAMNADDEEEEEEEEVGDLLDEDEVLERKKGR